MGDRGNWPDSSGMRSGEKMGKVRKGGWATEERGQCRHLNRGIILEHAHRNVVFFVGIVQHYRFYFLIFWGQNLVEWWKR